MNKPNVVRKVQHSAVSSVDSRAAPINAVSLGRDVCGALDSALRREWLVTNGIGGYASGTVAGIVTRRYHGLLVAALTPPLGRTVLASSVDISARYLDQKYALAAHEYGDGTVDPHGYRYIESFRLDGSIPVWRYALADGVLEKRIWMAHGKNTTYMQLSWERAQGAVELDLAALVTYRDYHSHSRGDWPFRSREVAGGIELTAYDRARPFRILCSGGYFVGDSGWYWNFRHRVESYRGLDDVEDLFRPGKFVVALQPGETVTLIATAEPDEPTAPSLAFTAERERQHALQTPLLASQPSWIQQLVLAADQFVVQRGNGADQTVIAGYPWFGDWGRDTMIALPGVALTTERYQIAATILRTFAKHVSEGMLPNRFPDGAEEPEYNTVDATLWFFHAINQYILSSGDESIARELYPVLSDIVEWHIKGTRYSIKVDAEDGLLYAGEAGVQLTWMDAKVGDWVVTPRIGKAVEINALWHNALLVMSKLATLVDDESASQRFRSMGHRVATAFRQRFWFEDGGYLYDVIDGPLGTPDESGRRHDASLRPNQLFAVSLSDGLLDEKQQRAVVDICARELFTPLGLRSLASRDSDYGGHYGGGQFERDGVYHQGTVWAWLLGPFAMAHYRVYKDAVTARSWLTGIAAHLQDAGLGTVSEIFDGDEPHTPRGCPAQAWSVSEVLRAWFELNAQS